MKKRWPNFCLGLLQITDINIWKYTSNTYLQLKYMQAVQQVLPMTCYDWNIVEKYSGNQFYTVIL